MMGRLLKYFGQDGLAHILASLVLCAVLGVFLPLWAAVIIALAVGFIKEVVWDMAMKKGTAEWRDIVSDAVGILLGVLIIILYTLWN